MVITIIVLLILAGVAINVVFNQEDLFNRANEAASKWNTAQQKEQNELNNIIHELQSLFKTEVTDKARNKPRKVPKEINKNCFIK